MTSSPGTALECADARPEPAACARKLRDGACGLKLWGCDRTCGLCEYSACIQSANITWTVSTLGNRSDFIALLQRALSQTRYNLRVMPAINGYDPRATMQALLSTGTRFHKLCGKVSDEEVENNLYRWGKVASFVTKVQRIQDQVREGWSYAFHIEDDARIHQWHVLRMVKSLCAHYCGGNFRDDCSRCLRNGRRQRCGRHYTPDIIQFGTYGEAYGLSLAGAQKMARQLRVHGIKGCLDQQLNFGELMNTSVARAYRCVGPNGILPRARTNSGATTRTKILSAEDLRALHSMVLPEPTIPRPARPTAPH